MTIKPTIRTVGLVLLLLSLSERLMAGIGGFNLELGPYAKIKQADFIITGEVLETEPTTKIRVHDRIKGKLEDSVISLVPASVGENAPSDIEEKQHAFTKGQVALIYLLNDERGLTLLQQGFGVQSADQNHVKAVRAAATLSVSPENSEILKKMLEGTSSEIAIVLDFMLLEDVSNLPNISAVPGLIENLEKLCHSSELAVRRDAARTLGRLGEKRALNSLLRLISDPSNAVAFSANDAVRFITKFSKITLPPNPTDEQKQAAVQQWARHLSR